MLIGLPWVCGLIWELPSSETELPEFQAVIFQLASPAGTTE